MLSRSKFSVRFIIHFQCPTHYVNVKHTLRCRLSDVAPLILTASGLTTVVRSLNIILNQDFTTLNNRSAPKLPSKKLRH
mgnify:CR=1 FL=1